MFTKENPHNVPVERLVREEMFDAHGVRIRARELAVDHGAYSRSLIELCLMDPEPSRVDTCVIDLRRAGDAATLLPIAVDAFAATVAQRRAAR